MPLLVDTGVLYALVDRTDAWHAPAVEYLKRIRPTLLVPVTVIPEAAYLVRTRLGAREEAALIKGVLDGGIAVEPLRDPDITRAAALMGTYPDLGFTDCTVVAMAERLALTTIATTDRRHFGVVQPRHATHFALVP
jgi:predicted nucleic acid-binding protein